MVRGHRTDGGFTLRNLFSYVSGLPIRFLKKSFFIDIEILSFNINLRQLFPPDSVMLYF
jgi:hypothetical protein